MSHEIVSVVDDVKIRIHLLPLTGWEDCAFLSSETVCEILSKYDRGGVYFVSLVSFLFKYVTSLHRHY